MAKLTVFVVLLVALLALAEASYRATITTTTIEEENPLEQQSRCRQQVQGRQFRNCRSYLRSPYVELEEEEEENQQYQQSLRQCCQELRNVDEQCQCEAIRHVVRQQGGGYGGQQQQQVLQKAQSLPRQCNLRSQQCRIQAVI